MAALVLGLGVVTAAILATALPGGPLHLALDGASFTPPDGSQLREAFARGELRLEVILIGSAITLAVGSALPLLVATRRSRHRSLAADTARGEPEDLGGVGRLDWPIHHGEPHLSAATSSRTVDQAPGIPVVAVASLDAAEAELLAAREAAAEVAALAAELAETWARNERPPVAPTEGWSPQRSPQSESAAIAGPWRRESLSPFTGPASILTVEALHLADARHEEPAIGSPEGPIVVELRGASDGRAVGPRTTLVAAIGTVAAGVAFSAGAAVGDTLGAGVGAAIGLAFSGGAGAAIGATVALLGSLRQ